MYILLMHIHAQLRSSSPADTTTVVIQGKYAHYVRILFQENPFL